MTALLAYLVVAGVAIAVSLAAAGPRRSVRRDPGFELHDVAGRHVSVLGALAGFAVTGSCSSSPSRAGCRTRPATR